MHISHDITPELSTYVDQLQQYYADALESVICFSPPFARLEQVLVAVNPSTPHLWPALEMAGPELVKEIDIICLRTDELFQLQFPGPNIALLNMPYWIQETGRVLWGRDLRKQIRCPSIPGQFLGCQLDRIQAERPRLIQYLMNKDYHRIQIQLGLGRVALMYTALLDRGIWQVYPATVRNQFLETYPDPELESNVEEFSTLENRMEEASEEQQRPVAYRQAWNFEIFLRLLRRYVR